MEKMTTGSMCLHLLLWLMLVEAVSLASVGQSDTNEYDQFNYALKYTNINHSKIYYDGISKCMTQEFSNDLPSMIGCAKEVAKKVASASFVNIDSSNSTLVTEFAEKHVKACQNYSNRELSCDYKVEVRPDDVLASAGFIKLIIKQSSCLRSIIRKGGTSFDVVFSPQGPPLRAYADTPQSRGSNRLQVVDRLALCRVMDHFNYTYSIVCPLAEIVSSSKPASSASVSDGELSAHYRSVKAKTTVQTAHHHQITVRSHPIVSYFPCVNISVNVDFEHFNAFSSCGLFGCHHSVLRRQILPLSVFCVRPSVSQKDSRRAPIEGTKDEDGVVLSKHADTTHDVKRGLDPKVWNNHVTGFYDGRWERSISHPVHITDQSAEGSSLSRDTVTGTEGSYEWRWNDIEVTSSGNPHSSTKSTHRKSDKGAHHVHGSDNTQPVSVGNAPQRPRGPDPLSLYQTDRTAYREQEMSTQDIAECLERTPMWLTGDSHLRYVWDFLVMQQRNETAAEHTRTATYSREDNYRDIFKHNWLTYASQGKFVIDHLIRNGGLGHLMNVTLSKKKINIVIHTGFWEIYTSPLHQYIINSDAVPSLLSYVRKLIQSPFRDRVRLIWVQTVPLPYAYCNHSHFESCMWVQISSRNNYAIKAMNQDLEKKLLRIGYPHLRIVRAYDSIMYPRRQFHEIVCNNHYMCFLDNELKMTPSCDALVQSIMRAACYY